MNPWPLKCPPLCGGAVRLPLWPRMRAWPLRLPSKVSCSMSRRLPAKRALSWPFFKFTPSSRDDRARSWASMEPSHSGALRVPLMATAPLKPPSTRQPGGANEAQTPMLGSSSCTVPDEGALSGQRMPWRGWCCTGLCRVAKIVPARSEAQSTWLRKVLPSRSSVACRACSRMELASVGLAQADACFVGALAADDGDRGGFFNIGGNAHVAIGPLQGGVQLGLGAAGVDVPAALQAQVAADAGALQNGVVRGEVVGPGQGQAAEFARAHHAPGGGVQCQGGPAHLGLLGLVFGGGGVSCRAPALAWMSGPVCPMVTGAARAKRQSPLFALGRASSVRVCACSCQRLGVCHWACHWVLMCACWLPWWSWPCKWAVSFSKGPCTVRVSSCIFVASCAGNL